MMSSHAQVYYMKIVAGIFNNITYMGEIRYKI